MQPFAESKVTGMLEVLDAWMIRARESTRKQTEYRDYYPICGNSRITVPQRTAEIHTVYPTKEASNAKKFEDTDGDA